VLDRQAKAEYRRHIAGLREDLRAAQAADDHRRAARIERDLAAVEHALRAATGLGGRSRAFRGPDDKAREAVSKAIHRSLRTIETYHPQLGRHLRGALKIGFRCSYIPDPPITWHT
jgi:DICT domain-containing protein